MKRKVMGMGWLTFIQDSTGAILGRNEIVTAPGWSNLCYRNLSETIPPQKGCSGAGS
jgi:hypothetical protein